jgi:hypothetical protein
MAQIVKKQFVSRNGQWVEILVGSSGGDESSGGVEEVAVQNDTPGDTVELWVDLDAPMPTDATSLQLYSSSASVQTGAPDIEPYAHCSVTLTPGSWIVTAGVSVYNATAADAAWGCLYNSTSGVIINSAGAAGMTRVDTNQAVPVSSAPTLVQVPAGTTMDVSPCAFGNGSSTLMVAGGALAPAAYISAIRIGLL